MKETFKDLPADILADLTSEKAKQEMIQDMVDLHFEPTSIHAIEYCVKLETLELLVTEFNADINHVGDDGYWPLLSFAEIENMEAVTWLLKHKADPNNTATGGTAIFKAVQNDDLEMTKLFIKHGAKINVQDVDGWTVLFACQSLQMAQYLIEQGADPTTLDQAAFPCWSFVDDPATKAYLKKIATQQGLKDWTEIPK